MITKRSYSHDHLSNKPDSDNNESDENNRSDQFSDTSFVYNTCEWFKNQASAHERLRLLCRLSDLSLPPERYFTNKYVKKLLLSDADFTIEVIFF